MSPARTAWEPVRALSAHPVVVAAGVVATSGLLWYAGMVIGLSSFGDARKEPMTSARWLAFWLLFVAIMAAAALTSVLGVRSGRRGGPIPHTRVRTVAITVRDAP